jgi:hypothetical protein
MIDVPLAPLAAASLEMTADFAPLLYGLCGLVIMSALGILLSALGPRLRRRRRAPHPSDFLAPAPEAR